jgi:hypothetical protein
MGPATAAINKVATGAGSGVLLVRQGMAATLKPVAGELHFETDAFGTFNVR